MDVEMTMHTKNVHPTVSTSFEVAMPQPTWLDVHHLVHTLWQECAAGNDQAASSSAALNQGHSTRVVACSKHTGLHNTARQQQHNSTKWIRTMLWDTHKEGEPPQQGELAK